MPSQIPKAWVIAMLQNDSFYEYLIKHFADLTNKKAGEFYTPRYVIHLPELIPDPHEGEAIYDPACGTGGFS